MQYSMAKQKGQPPSPPDFQAVFREYHQKYLRCGELKEQIDRARAAGKKREVARLEREARTLIKRLEEIQKHYRPKEPF